MIKRTTSLALALLFVATTAQATRIGVFDAGSQIGTTQTFYGKEAKAAGIESVRLMLNLTGYGRDSWYTWGLTHGLIPQIKAYRAAGIPYITVSVSSNTCSSGNGCFTMPKAGQFKAFMQMFVADMGATLQQVDAVEILNEWDSGAYGPHITPEQYVDLYLKDAYTVLKAAKPTIKVVSGSVVIGHEAYMQQINSLGKGYFDAFAYHPYGQDLANLIKYLDKGKAVATATGVPIYLTEWGCTDWIASANCNANMASYLEDAIDAIVERGFEESDYTIFADTFDKNYTSLALLNGYNSAQQGDFTETKIYSVFKATIAKYASGTPATPPQEPPTSPPTSPTDPTPPYKVTLKGSAFRVVSAIKTTDLYGECLNVYQVKKTPGSAVVLYPCAKNAQSNELFQWSTDNALVVYGSMCVIANAAGALVLDTCNGTPAQAWKFSPTNSSLTFATSGKVLDIPGRKVNVGKATTLELYKSNNGTNQQWIGPTAN